MKEAELIEGGKNKLGEERVKNNLTSLSCSVKLSLSTPRVRDPLRGAGSREATREKRVSDSYP